MRLAEALFAELQALRRLLASPSGLRLPAGSSYANHVLRVLEVASDTDALADRLFVVYADQGEQPRRIAAGNGWRRP